MNDADGPPDALCFWTAGRGYYGTIQGLHAGPVLVTGDRGPPFHEDQRVGRVPGADAATNHGDRLSVTKEFIRERYGGVACGLVQTELSFGTYHPRVWRGFFKGYGLGVSGWATSGPTVEVAQRVSSIVAATNLLGYVSDAFRVLEPASANAGAFGHRLRELLILLCTEIEASWKGVLVSNGVTKNRMATCDYVKLLEPLRLGVWRVRLVDYRDFGELSPFASWTPANPTRSLTWYDDYNAVKHDREGSFSRATLGSLVSAAAALHILQAAQWGPEAMSASNKSSPFVVSEAPRYDFPELYYPRANLDGSFAEWEPKKLEFRS